MVRRSVPASALASSMFCKHQLGWVQHRSLRGISASSLAASQPQALALSCGGGPSGSPSEGYGGWSSLKTRLPVHIHRHSMQRERLHPPRTDPSAAWCDVPNSRRPWLLPESLALGKALCFGFKRQVAGEMAALPVFMLMQGFQHGRGDAGDSVSAAVTCVFSPKTMSHHAGGHSSHRTLYSLYPYNLWH